MLIKLKYNTKCNTNKTKRITNWINTCKKLQQSLNISLLINVLRRSDVTTLTDMMCPCVVLLYIREQHEAVFTAILLETPTVSSLIYAVRSPTCIFVAASATPFIYTCPEKKVPLYFCLWLREMLTDFQNSFTITICSKFAAKKSINILP